MDKDKVEKLAKLARIELNPEEIENISKELGSILGYVSDIKEAGLKKADDGARPEVRNVFREDSGAHESGIYSEEVLKLAPDKKEGYIRVKKIL